MQMKKLLGTLLLSAIAFGGVVAQKSVPAGFAHPTQTFKRDKSTVRSHNSSSRAVTKKFFVDYGIYEGIVQAPADSVTLTVGQPINKNWRNTKIGSLRSAFVFFDSIVDINAAVTPPTATPYSAADYSLTFDTFDIAFIHTNTTATTDTLTLTVFDLSAVTITGTGPSEVINTPALWSQTITVNTSIPKNAFGGQVTFASFAPNVTLPKGKTFGVRVDFAGDTLNTFRVLNTFNNLCNGACLADTARIPNTFYYGNFDFGGANNFSGFNGYNSLIFSCPTSGCGSLFFYDQNYFISGTFTGTQPCHTLSFTSTPAACGTSNGSATVTATAGFAPYNYAWSTTPAQTTATASGLAAGKYKVTVTGTSGCVTVDSVTIVNSGGPNAPTVAKTDVACFGGATGTATATAAGGGTAPYTFAWSTSPAQTTATATGLAAGSYTVTIKDAANCINTATVTVGQTATAVSGTVSAVDAKCFGASTGTAIAVGSGGSGPYSYNWSTNPAQANDSALNVAAGSYTVTITDSKSCTTTKTVTVGQAATAVSATVTTTNTAQGQQGGSAIAAVTGGSAPYTYSWDGSGSTTNTATGLGAGSYFVSVTDSKGCVDTTNFTISVISGIEQVGTAFSAVKVFPNPVKTDVSIQATLEKTENVTIEVIDITGKVVTSKVITGANTVDTSFNLSNIARGTYTIKLSTPSGSVKNRIVLQ
jgi:hypothetical protein